MPGMNGSQLAREIVNQDPEAKICFVTAIELLHSELEQVFAKSSEICVMRKPVPMNVLLKLVKSRIGT